MRTLQQLRVALRNGALKMQSEYCSEQFQQKLNYCDGAVELSSAGDFISAINEINNYETQARNSYNSAVSSCNSNVQYYNTQDKATYDNNDLNIIALRNSLTGKTEDIMVCRNTIEAKNAIFSQKATATASFLNNLTPSKLSDILIKSIEANNVDIQNLVKTKNFDPTYKTKGACEKTLLEVEITHDKQELFDLTMSKHPQITQEIKAHLISVAINKPTYLSQVNDLVPISLMEDDNITVNTEMINQEGPRT